MKKLILILFVIAGMSATLSAQEYDKAIGLRAGYPWSISYKHFLNESNALELMAGYWSYGNSVFYSWSYFSLGGAYLIHKPTGWYDGINWYWGAGARAQFWSFDYDASYLDDEYDNFSFGLGGYIGLDYKFENIPLNVSVDAAPHIVIGGFHSGLRFYGGAAARYTF